MVTKVGGRILATKFGIVPDFETEMGISENYNWLPVFRTSIDSCFAGPTLFLPVSGIGPAGYFEDYLS